jgi:hypothetical protein
MSKKVNLGGDRLGSGAKINARIEAHGRSSFNLSNTFYSDMNVGTLIPFMCEVALPGTTADIGLSMDCFTLPTVGPMFGTYKAQLDIFKVPIRLYQSSLHMNRNEVGQDMDKIILPKMKLKAKQLVSDDFVNNDPISTQINPSSLFPYLGVRMVGSNTGAFDPEREFNAMYHMAYWDIYKNFYANKQEKVGKFINARSSNFDVTWNIPGGADIDDEIPIQLDLNFDLDIVDHDSIYEDTNDIRNNIFLKIDGQAGIEIMSLDAADGNILTINSITNTVNDWSISFTGDDDFTILVSEDKNLDLNYEFSKTNVGFKYGTYINETTFIDEFDLKNLDKMRLDCLKADDEVPFYLTDLDYSPFNQYNATQSNGAYNKTLDQNLLALKTFQSDRFNNWLDSEYIDKVNKNSQVAVTNGSFTMDALNLARKVYKLENQITAAGGTYQDWQEVVYGVYGGGTQEQPMYVGGLQAEITFAEVTSNAASADEPLGTLAGKGRMNQFKGGNIMVKCNEPCMIIGIVSITPRLSYSQGNKWFNEIDTMDDFHKPEFDAIAFQDLIMEEAVAWSTRIDQDGTITKHSGGKQTSWIEYQTNVNENYGGFAERNKLMFMVNDRQYEPYFPTSSQVFDWTTYIDPSKFNYCFADTTLNSRNFWVGIGKHITMRRVMSAKQIPNL